MLCNQGRVLRPRRFRSGQEAHRSGRERPGRLPLATRTQTLSPDLSQNSQMPISGPREEHNSIRSAPIHEFAHTRAASLVKSTTFQTRKSAAVGQNDSVSAWPRTSFSARPTRNGAAGASARGGTAKSTVVRALRMSGFSVGFFGYPTFAKAKSSLHTPNPVPASLRSSPVVETRHSRQSAVKPLIPLSAFMSGLWAYLTSKTGRLHLSSCRIDGLLLLLSGLSGLSGFPRRVVPGKFG